MIQKGNVDAVALASILHYSLLETVSNKGDYQEEGNTDFLSETVVESHTRKKLSPVTIIDLKQYLGWA